MTENLALAGARRLAMDRSGARGAVEGNDRPTDLDMRGTTNFWLITQGHPSKHDGQADVIAVEGDFVFEATFDAQLTAQFDQTGLFVERDRETWLKAAVELDGAPWLSARHTRGPSDWSREPSTAYRCQSASNASPTRSARPHRPASRGRRSGF